MLHYDTALSVYLPLHPNSKSSHLSSTPTPMAMRPTSPSSPSALSNSTHGLTPTTRMHTVRNSRMHFVFSPAAPLALLEGTAGR